MYACQGLLHLLQARAAKCDRSRYCPCCLQGLEDVNTELIIMIEEGLTESFSSQGELELKATLERARHVKVPSPEARPKTRGI